MGDCRACGHDWAYNLRLRGNNLSHLGAANLFGNCSWIWGRSNQTNSKSGQSSFRSSGVFCNKLCFDRSFGKFKAVFGKALAGDTDLEIKADSELVVKQLNGDYRLSEPKIQQFFIEIWNLKFDFKSVKFKHIPREKNKEADRLVNETLDQEAGAKSLF